MGRRASIIGLVVGLIGGVWAPAFASGSSSVELLKECAEGVPLGGFKWSLREVGVTNLRSFNIVLGTVGNDQPLTGLTPGPDLICGLGGIDELPLLEEGDVFLGGADPVLDVVVNMTGGVFVGGPGNDIVIDLNGGSYFGGPGTDQAFTQSGGVFNGGDDVDFVDDMLGGTFNGEKGDDRVIDFFGGIFDGGPGTDSVDNYYAGTCVDVEIACY